MTFSNILSKCIAWSFSVWNNPNYVSRNTKRNNLVKIDFEVINSTDFCNQQSFKSDVLSVIQRNTISQKRKEKNCRDDFFIEQFSKSRRVVALEMKVSWKNCCKHFTRKTFCRNVTHANQSIFMSLESWMGYD